MALLLVIVTNEKKCFNTDLGFYRVFFDNYKMDSVDYSNYLMVTH